MIATWQGYLDFVKLLVAEGADINLKSKVTKKKKFFLN
jgi:ankyrin repeat protein